MNSNKEQSKLYRRKYKAKIAKERPWYKHWRAVYTRCVSPSHRYFQRGISCLTPDEMLFIWNRDNASTMNSPSVDRIDTSGNYSLSNCRFIERSENIKRTNCRTDGRFVQQQKQSGEIVGTFLNCTEAMTKTGINDRSIRFALSGRYSHAGGYKWHLVKAIKTALEEGKK